jgi:adenosylhomocysteinase
VKFSLHQVGVRLPDAAKQAADIINTTQTVWRLEWSRQIDKPKPFNLEDNFAVLPDISNCGIKGAYFIIGITAGRVDQAQKLSSIDYSNKKALVSEFSWRQLYPEGSVEQFWVMALANICFQASIGRSCTQHYCLGFQDYNIDNFASKLLALCVCNDCEHEAMSRYKYQVPEIRMFVDFLKRTDGYKSFPDFEIPNLPVLARQIRRQEKVGSNTIFQKYGIIIVMHFLEDLVPFLEGLITLGAAEESIILLVKPYPYAQRTQVHSYLYQKHPAIRIEYLQDLPPDEGLLKELVEHCQGKSRSGKLLVIEDGGYIVPFLHVTYSKEENFCVGAVEQTTKGLRRDEALTEYYFPILNVAKSDFKDQYESPLIGDAVASSIERLLPDERLRGQRALVFGFGAVGEHVVKTLNKRGMHIYVCDSERERVITAKEEGFEASESPTEDVIQKSKFMIGTAGANEPTIKSDILDKMGDGTILMSTSSDRAEIDIEHLEIIASEQKYEEGLGTYYFKKYNKSLHSYLLLADGYPINFYSGSGIPNRAIDPILAQLFIGATYIANKENLDTGILNIMNKLIKDYKLVDDFLAEYHR